MATVAASNNGDRLGEVLLREGMLTREQLATAMAEAKTGKHRLGYVLVKLGMVPELEITKVLARQYRMPAVDLSRFEVDPRILKLVPAEVVARYRGRILNIHPAPLPDFGGPGMYGRRVHEAVLASGVAETGATVHLVDEEYDRGDILAQTRVRVEPGDTPDTLAARVLATEHRLLPAVVLAAARAGRPVPLTGDLAPRTIAQP
jgi:hypothetical protein